MKRYLHYSRKERGSHSAEVLVNVVKRLSCKIQKITLRVSQKLHSDYSQVKIALPSFQNQNRSRLSCSYAIAMLLLVLKITLAQSYTISIKFWDLLSGTSNQAIFLCQDTKYFLYRNKIAQDLYFLGLRAVGNVPFIAMSEQHRHQTLSAVLQGCRDGQKGSNTTGYFSKPVLVILLRSSQGFSIINGQNVWEKFSHITFLPCAMAVSSSFQELTIESLHFNQR